MYSTLVDLLAIRTHSQHMRQFGESLKNGTSLLASIYIPTDSDTVCLNWTWKRGNYQCGH